MTSEPPSVADLQKALADFKDPETGLAAAGQKQIRDLNVSGTTASLTLALSTHSAPLWKETKERLTDFVRARLPGLTDVKINLAVHDRPPQKLGQVGLTAKSVIAVGSGKGGVGKSTIAAAVALGLKRAGSKVGLLDTDVYGPSIPHLLGLEDAPPPAVVDGKVPPVVFDGMPVMSMGFLLPPGKAVVWRGPMLHSYVTQFLRDVAWGDLDYLIIDMPPGTGDVAISLGQLLPRAEAIVVTTPQPAAQEVAARAGAMAQKTGMRLLGVVENMAGDVFGSGGGERLAAELDAPLLGSIPLEPLVRECGDAADPIVSAAPEAAASAELRRIAETVLERRAGEIVKPLTLVSR
jgi:ATP-binding protein involved in chromosome partitioning